MEEKKKYNGWTNYETWLVKLWIDNEEGDYNFWREAAKEAREKREEDDENSIWDILEELKKSYDENNPVKIASVWSDLMRAALGEVDWYEIAKSIINEVKEEDAEEE